MTTQDATPVQKKPNPLRTVLLVVGSIILAIILVGTIARFAFAGNGEDTSGTFTVAQQVDTIELRASAADVTVEYTDVNEPEIRFDQGSTNLRLDYDVSGGELDIRVDRPGWGWWGFGFGDWGWSEGATLELSLPESMERDGVALKVETTAGNLTVAGKFGDVELESTAGDVRMAGATDDLEIRTTAGNVRLNGVEVDGSFLAESTAGDSTIEFGSLPDSIEMHSTAGNVSVLLPSGNYRIETDTTAGNVTQNVSSDQNSDRTYRFESTAGDIVLDER
jgi:DUF4097 and DUF4098 domain-containing protein YvlB